MNQEKRQEINNWLKHELGLDEIVRIYHVTGGHGEIAYILGRKGAHFLLFNLGADDIKHEVWHGCTWSHRGIQQIIFARQIRCARIE